MTTITRTQYDNRELWTDFLRYAGLKQIRHSLVKTTGRTNEIYGYCCLGVAGALVCRLPIMPVDVKDKGNNEKNVMQLRINKNTIVIGTLDNDFFMKTFGVTYLVADYMQPALAALNDDARLSFVKIAGIVELLFALADTMNDVEFYENCEYIKNSILNPTEDALFY